MQQQAGYCYKLNFEGHYSASLLGVAQSRAQGCAAMPLNATCGTFQCVGSSLTCFNPLIGLTLLIFAVILDNFFLALQHFIYFLNSGLNSGLLSSSVQCTATLVSTCLFLQYFWNFCFTFKITLSVQKFYGMLTLRNLKLATHITCIVWSTWHYTVQPFLFNTNKQPTPHLSFDVAKISAYLPHSHNCIGY